MTPSKLGTPEIIIIGIVVLVLFNVLRKLPELIKGMRIGIKEFKKEIRDLID